MSKLTAKMEAALAQFQESKTFVGHHPSTVRGLERRGLIQMTEDKGWQLQDMPDKGNEFAVSESHAVPRNNRLRLNFINRQWGMSPTHDVGQPDYAFFDKLRRGRAQGLELAGLFIKPLASKVAAWSMGLMPRFSLSDDTAQVEINKWWNKHHHNILRAKEESAALGDQYVVVNGDMSLTVLPPHVVEPIIDEKDYSKRVGYRITERHEHPTEFNRVMTIVDEYTVKERVRTRYLNRKQIARQRFPNLIGRVPVVHIPFNKGTDESHGHPIGEALVKKALRMYEEIFDAAFSGNKLQGRPTPVFEEMGSPDQIEAFWQTFGKKIVTENADGTSDTSWVLDFASDQALTLGNNGKFKWAQPGSFTKDTEVLLGLLFYLVLQHEEIPEFIWGNAIQGSKASAEVQLPPFEAYINKLRAYDTGWITELITVVLAYTSIWETGIGLNFEEELDVNILWPKLVSQDGTLTLDAIKLGMDKGLLDEKTALEHMPLDIDDPQTVLDKAKAEAEEAQVAFDRRNDDFLQGLQGPQSLENDPVDDEEEDDPAQEMTSPTRARYTTPLQQTQQIMTLQTVSEAHHDGVMVALDLTKGTMVRALANTLTGAVIRAGVPKEQVVDDHHLTLAYLGKIDEVATDQEGLVNLIRHWAERYEPVMGRVGGIGRFTTNEGSGLNALYAHFDSPGLARMREDLVMHLQTHGIRVEMNHGFTPHITLAYIPADMAMPDVRLPELAPITLRNVVVGWGDQWEFIEMVKREKVAA